MSKKREWEACILEWERSGMKIEAWCREHNLKASTMRYWHKKLGETKPKDIQFTEIHPKAKNESKIVIKIKDVQIEITETTNLELMGRVVKAISTC